jgi:putative Ca2+/H+ antiporter (TMEM165/GDT1 family)
VKLSSVPLASPIHSAPAKVIEPTFNKDAPSETNSTRVLTPKPPLTPSPKPQTVKGGKRGVWSVFSSTFLTIFLAEIGDKTQLATLLMSAESQSPWVVFAGAATALIATSLLGVLLGRWLSHRLSPKTLETSAGLLLLFISVMLLWDVIHINS